VLLELGRWGSKEEITTTGELTPDALLVALKTAFDPSAAPAGTIVYELDFGGDAFTMTVSGGSLDVTRGRAGREPATGLRGDVATMRAVAFGREPMAAAEQAGRLTVTGDRRLAEGFTRMFPLQNAMVRQPAR